VALAYTAKVTTLDFSNMSGGINTTDPATDIKPNQVQSALNAIFTNKGFGRCYGLAGLKASATFGTSGKGIHVYEKSDGTEILLAAAGTKLYSIDTSTGEPTELYDFGTSGEVYFVNYLGVCFCCNGTKMVKYDGVTAYQAGIDAPAGVTAAAVAGGTLPDGVYQIYVGYARKVSGSNVLYGSGQLVSSVTLTTGNNSITFSNFSNSSDPQVNNKIVWMTDAAGGTFYFFHETGDNTTTTFTITDTTDRDDTRQYDVLAAYNHVPVTPEYIFVSDNRIWYTSGNQAFFSLQAGTVYDLEKFDTEADGNLLTFPYQIEGGFPLGKNICFNTTSGIIVLPNGDISQAYEIKGAPYYFKYPRTIDVWNNTAIGVTNDGVRLFDGESFSAVNISRDIKAAIQRCYADANDTFVPCGKVIRNKVSARAEYILSFMDTSVSGFSNNRQWVLDLDSLNIAGADSYNTQWEQWQYGYQYVSATKDGVVYCLQSMPGESNVVKFSNNSTADKWIYNDNGTWVADLTNRDLKIKTGERVPDLLGFCRWLYLHLFGLASGNITFRVGIGDDFTRNSQGTFVPGSTAQPLFDESQFDIAVFGENTVIKKKLNMNKKMKGNSVFVEITQTADDTNLNFNRVLLTGIIKRSRKS
jgi:hypothetical protein